jgi:hypothetical protein
MEISTFEILTAPIAPVIGLPPVLLPVARRIVQGYFLTISNLEAFSVVYRIDFTVSLPVAADPNKILLNNAVLLVDFEGPNTEVPLTQPGPPELYRAFFTIPAHKTASVQLLPKLPDVLTPGLLEVRGYVSLSRAVFGLPPESFPPVKVLLNPEIRGTFLPNNFPSAATTDLDFDQINYTLAIASGKGLNEISNVSGSESFAIDLSTLEPILQQLPNGTLNLASLEADNSKKAQMLVQLLAQLDASEVCLKDLNTVMEKIDIPIRMSTI